MTQIVTQPGQQVIVAPPKRLPKKKSKAAILVAEDRKTDEEIAASCKITRRTLARWKLEPLFDARVTALQEQFAEQIAKIGISRREVRVQKLHNRLADLETFARERGETAEMANVPGGNTGYVARKVKVIGFGEKAKEVAEYGADLELIKAQQGIMEQVAVELGQKIEKHQVDARVGYFVLQRKSVADEGRPTDGARCLP